MRRMGRGGDGQGSVLGITPCVACPRVSGRGCPQGSSRGSSTVGRMAVSEPPACHRSWGEAVSREESG